MRTLFWEKAKIRYYEKRLFANEVNRNLDYKNDDYLKALLLAHSLEKCDYYANLYDIMDRLADEVIFRLTYEPECYHTTAGTLEGYSLLVEKLFMQSKEKGVAYEN